MLHFLRSECSPCFRLFPHSFLYILIESQPKLVHVERDDDVVGGNTKNVVHYLDSNVIAKTCVTSFEDMVGMSCS